MKRNTKNSSGKIIGEITYYRTCIIVNTFSKNQKVIIDNISIMNNMTDIKTFEYLWDMYILNVSEIANILNICYSKCNRIFKVADVITSKKYNRRNSSWNRTFSDERCQNIGNAGIGRVSWAKGLKMPESTKQKISDTLTSRMLESPELFTSHKRFGYRGYFKSIRYNCRYYYRSLLELFIMFRFEYDDIHESVEWEPFRIQYSMNNKIRYYIPDVLVDNKILYEIKPVRYSIFTTDSPEEFSGKIISAMKYCDKNNYTFRLLTDLDTGYNSYLFHKYLNNNKDLLDIHKIPHESVLPFKERK